MTIQISLAHCTILMQTAQKFAQNY